MALSQQWIEFIVLVVFDIIISYQVSQKPTIFILPSTKQFHGQKTGTDSDIKHVKKR